MKLSWTELVYPLYSLVIYELKKITFRPVAFNLGITKPLPSLQTPANSKLVFSWHADSRQFSTGPGREGWGHSLPRTPTPSVCALAAAGVRLGGWSVGGGEGVVLPASRPAPAWSTIPALCIFKNRYFSLAFVNLQLIFGE